MVELEYEKFFSLLRNDTTLAIQYSTLNEVSERIFGSLLRIDSSEEDQI